MLITHTHWLNFNFKLWNLFSLFSRRYILKIENRKMYFIHVVASLIVVSFVLKGAQSQVNDLRLNRLFMLVHEEKLREEAAEREPGEHNHDLSAFIDNGVMGTDSFAPTPSPPQFQQQQFGQSQQFFPQPQSFQVNTAAFFLFSNNIFYLFFLPKMCHSLSRLNFKRNVCPLSFPLQVSSSARAIHLVLHLWYIFLIYFSLLDDQLYFTI